MHLVRLICLIQCDLCHWHRSASTTSCSYFRMSRSLFRIQGQKAAAHYISTADVAFVQLCIPELLIRSRRVAKLWGCKPLPCSAGATPRSRCDCQSILVSNAVYTKLCSVGNARCWQSVVTWSHSRSARGLLLAEFKFRQAANRTRSISRPSRCSETPH